MREPGTIPYRSDIDGLRAVAVLLILVFHFFPEQWPAGFAGVDMFFTISGFLISQIICRQLHDANFGFIEFYKRRVRRLFPALLAVLVAVLLMGWYLLFQDEFIRLGKHVVAGIGFYINFLFYNESGYFSRSAESLPLLHLWSLSVEEQFYLVWPALLLLLQRWRILNAYSLAVLTGLSIAANFCIHDTDGLFYWPFARLWEFSAGALAALAYPAFQQARIPRRDDVESTLSYMALIMIGFGIFLLSTSPSRNLMNVWPVILGTSGLLLAGPQSLINAQILSLNPLRYLGRISYPLYLWHWPLLVFARLAGLGSPDVKLVLALTAAALAALTYHFIEIPMRKHPFAFSNLSAAGLLVAVVGAAVCVDGRILARSPALEDVAKIEYGHTPVDSSCRLLLHKAGHDDWCDRGDHAERTPSVVVIGDSFSPSFGNMLRQFANRHPDADLVYRAFGQGRCPPVLDYGPSYCKDFVRAEYKYILNTPEIQTVAIAANWRRYIYGSSWDEENHSETDRSFAVALKKSVALLVGSHKHVIAMLAQPLGVDPATCVDRLAGFAVRATCATPAKRALASDGDARRLLPPFFRTRGVDVFDPFPYFCSDGQCAILDGRKALYGFDGLHMDPFGGEFLALQARDQIQRLFVDDD